MGELLARTCIGKVRFGRLSTCVVSHSICTCVISLSTQEHMWSGLKQTSYILKVRTHLHVLKSGRRNANTRVSMRWSCFAPITQYNTCQVDYYEIIDCKKKKKAISLVPKPEYDSCGYITSLLRQCVCVGLAPSVHEIIVLFISS